MREARVTQLHTIDTGVHYWRKLIKLVDVETSASLAAAVLDALVGLALGALGAARLGASLAAAVLDALVGLAHGALGAARLGASLAAAVPFALVGLAHGALGAARLGASLAAAVPFALVGLAPGALGAARLGASIAAAVLDALVDLSVVSSFCPGSTQFTRLGLRRAQTCPPLVSTNKVDGRELHLGVRAHEDGVLLTRRESEVVQNAKA